MKVIRYIAEKFVEDSADAVKVIVGEIHVKSNEEGIVIDIVRDGKVIRTKCWFFDDLIDTSKEEG